MRSPPSSNNNNESLEHAPKGRELLWVLWNHITERCLEEIQKPKCSPTWAGICVAWCRWNEIRLTKGARSAASALQSLKGSVDQLGALSAPFGSVGHLVKHDEEKPR